MLITSLIRLKSENEHITIIQNVQKNLQTGETVNNIT